MSDQEIQEVAKRTEEAGTISVSDDYLAFLHDEISDNQARLREILGESQARAVFSWCADRLVRTAKAGRYVTSPIEGVVQKLTIWGMAVSWREEGDLTKVETKCPYSRRTHARLSSRESVCPVGEYLLGAVRLEDPKSQLVHNSLTEDGVRFTLSGSHSRR